VSLRRDRRDEILTSAARLFAASGFHGVSIDDLGAELGISGPAIYRYFPSKESILGDMLVDISQRLLEGAGLQVSGHHTPETQLLALIGFHVEFALGDRDLIAVQFRDLGHAPERDRRRVRQLQRSYVAVWVRVLQHVYPDVSLERAQSSVQAVFGLLNSTPHSGRAGEPHMAELLRDMAFAALRAACNNANVNDR
jgi:AcrR family transcriptional regulator